MMDHNQWEESNYDCEIVFDDFGPTEFSFQSLGKPNSISYEMISVTQPDGTIVKKMAEVYRYDNETLCFTNPPELNGECVCESLL